MRGTCSAPVGFEPYVLYGGKQQVWKMQIAYQESADLPTMTMGSCLCAPTGGAFDGV